MTKHPCLPSRNEDYGFFRTMTVCPERDRRSAEVWMLASRLIAEIHKIVGVPVHQPTGRSLQLTKVGEALARRAQRILIELRDAARDIEGITEGTTGTIRIGSVTGPAIEHLLPALLLLLLPLMAPAASAELLGPPRQLWVLLVPGGSLDVAWVGDKATLGLAPKGPVHLQERVG